jgi:hypothetical protein
MCTCTDRKALSQIAAISSDAIPASFAVRRNFQRTRKVKPRHFFAMRLDLPLSSAGSGASAALVNAKSDTSDVDRLTQGAKR